MALKVRSSPEDRLKRLLQLVRILQCEPPKTENDLMDLLGISRRTIFRDLKLLTEAGVSVTYDRTTGKYSITPGLPWTLQARK